MSREFAAHVCELLAPLGPVTPRAMFGGFGLYLEGRMFGLIAWDTLFFKTDDGNRADYLTAGMDPFRPYADRATTMPYHEVPPELLEDGERLCLWGRKAFEVALRAPVKAKRKASPARSA